MKIKFLIFAFLTINLSFAQQKKSISKATDPKAQVFESKHAVTIDGKTINLNAKAGTMEFERRK